MNPVAEVVITVAPKRAGDQDRHLLEGPVNSLRMAAVFQTGRSALQIRFLP